MKTKQKWAARAVVVGLSATALIGVNSTSASALGSTCTPPGSRPSGPLVTALAPTLGWPGYPKTALGDSWVGIVAIVDEVVLCQILP